MMLDLESLDFNVISKMNETVFKVVVKKGFFQIALKLVNKVDFEDEDLHFVARYGCDLELVKLVLDKCDPKVRNSRGLTADQVARRNFGEQSNIYKVLFEARNRK